MAGMTVDESIVDVQKKIGEGNVMEEHFRLILIDLNHLQLMEVLMEVLLLTKDQNRNSDHEQNVAYF